MKEDSDFEDLTEESEEEQKANSKTPEGEQTFTRVRLPRGREVLGTIEQRHGGNKMKVICLDGKERNCRVPGRLKRALWLRPGDIVIIEPWELDNTKGDVLFKYRPTQIDWLRAKGYIKKETSGF